MKRNIIFKVLSQTLMSREHGVSVSVMLHFGKTQKISIILMIKETIITMKSLLSSNRSKAILSIGLIAIGIGAISKKVISYPNGDCMKGTEELTLNKGLNKLVI